MIGELIGTTLLKHNLEQLNDLVIDGVVEKWDQFETKYNKNFKDYFEKSVEKYNKVRTILNDKEQELVKIFQPTSLYEESKNGRDITQKRIKPDEFLSVLDEKKCVWITGHGGIGKSTLLKHTMLTILMDEKNSKSKIPVYIELRKYNHEEAERRKITEFIYHEMTVLNFGLEKELFDFMLMEGRFTFLFDAYDEITSERSQIFLTEFDDFLTKYDKNNVIISSRFMPYGHLDNFVGLHELRTHGLTQKESVDLIKKTDYYEDIKQEFTKSLSESLYDEYETIASNPVLLLLMLSLFRENSNFPKKKSTFLIKAFEELFERHDGRKIAYSREFKTSLTKFQMMKVFSAFCFLTYFDTNASKNEFSEDSIRKTIRKVMDSYSWLTDNSGITVDDIIYDLRVCLCVLYKEGEYYYYVHNIFQEFFSAYYIYMQGEKAQGKFLEKYIINGRGGTISRNLNFRLIQTTFEYIYELDDAENQNVIRYNLLLPLLELVEKNPEFVDYLQINKNLGYEIQVTEESIAISLERGLLDSIEERALLHLYRLYKYRGKNLVFVGRKSKEKISESEYKEIINLASAKLVKGQILRANTESPEPKIVDLERLIISIEDVFRNDILKKLYSKTHKYRQLTELNGLSADLREEKKQRENEEVSLL
ncbi:NACHT domain-containing protein [Enterococcus sp. AZ101]|uniref:NACHT domain-containing protein n=1 Tax=Enterococcus sp. AZ101 TaxID=2774742 RepID=UPI003D2E8AE4